MQNRADGMYVKLNGAVIGQQSILTSEAILPVYVVNGWTLNDDPSNGYGTFKPQNDVALLTAVWGLRAA